MATDRIKHLKESLKTIEGVTCTLDLIGAMTVINLGGDKMKSIDRIEILKKSIKAVETMPLLQRPGHIMPLVHELIAVLEQQSKDIARLQAIADGQRQERIWPEKKSE